jgi:hypothetical protein
VQVYYGPGHGDNFDLAREIDQLCSELDPTGLFIWIITDSVEKADALVRRARAAAAAR